MTDQSKDLIFHIHNKLGDVVRAWREARKITVTELAVRAGEPISKGYISEVENNKIRTPNDEYLIRIAEALNIPVEYLVLRQLPDEQLEASDRGEREGDFNFAAPIPSLRQEDDLTEEEALLQTLDQIDRLVKQARKLIRQKVKKR